MKSMSLLSTTFLAVAVSSPLAIAQNSTTAPAAAPAAAVVNATEAPAVDHVIYLARLPSPAELMQGAEMQHAKIDRMDQSSDRIVAVYSYANGRTVTFAYTLLSAIASQPNVTLTAAQPGASAPPSTVVYSAPQPATTVVYSTPPQTVYYEPAYTRYYDPVWDFWAPLAIGVGLGWGWHGGGWHGGWHGGGHGWHGGGHGWHH